jgi:hypothetical protein
MSHFRSELMRTNELRDVEDSVQYLLTFATDDELDVLEALRIRAGVLWKCRSCNWVTPSHRAVCEGCGRQRRRDLETS